MFRSDRMGQRTEAGRSEGRGQRWDKARVRTEQGTRTESKAGIRTRIEVRTYLFQVIYSSI
jgi:hypothetical protein